MILFSLMSMQRETMNSLTMLNGQVFPVSLTNTGRENDGLRVIQELILSSMKKNKPHRSWRKKTDTPALRGFRVMLSYFIGQIYG
ncbi:hypothetical protein AKG16_13340 [Morganella morganii]|nr:hypothetical protein AKG16_13340 [Morganella morganii]